MPEKKLRFDLESDGGYIAYSWDGVMLPFKELYELKHILDKLELCHECYEPVEPESSMGNGYHPGCFQNMMERFR